MGVRERECDWCGVVLKGNRVYYPYTPEITVDSSDDHICSDCSKESEQDFWSKADWVMNAIDATGVTSREAVEKTLMAQFAPDILDREFGRPTFSKEGKPEMTPIRLIDYCPYKPHHDHARYVFKDNSAIICVGKSWGVEHEWKWWVQRIGGLSPAQPQLVDATRA